MPSKKLPIDPEWTPKPKRPAGRNAERLRAHLFDMLAWVKENRIACIPQEFCDYAEIGRTTLKSHEDIAELVNQHGWDTSRARMRRGKSSRPEKAKERVDSRILREHARWKAENDALREQVGAAEERIAALQRDVDRLVGYSALLENYTDVLLHELAIRDRRTGREMEDLLRSVRSGSLPPEFMDAIRQANRDRLAQEEDAA